MNDPVGLKEVQSSTFRSPWSGIQHEHRHRFGTTNWNVFRSHNASALSTDMSVEQEKAPATLFCPNGDRVSREERVDASHGQASLLDM